MFKGVKEGEAVQSCEVKLEPFGTAYLKLYFEPMSISTGKRLDKWRTQNCSTKIFLLLFDCI